MCARPRINPYKDSRVETSPEAVQIQEDKISEQCIEQVAKDMGLTYQVVRQVHDFQWGLVKETLDNYKTVFVSKFFKLLPRLPKVRTLIFKKKKVLVELQKKIDSKEIDARSVIHDRNRLNTEIEQLEKLLVDFKPAKEKKLIEVRKKK